MPITHWACLRTALAYLIFYRATTIFERMDRMVDLSNVSNSASNSNREAGLVRSDNFCKTRIRAAVGRTPFPTNISSHCFVDMSYLSYLITIQKYEQFPNIHSSKKHVHVFQNSRTCFRKKTYVFFPPHILIFFYFAKRLSLNRLR